MTAACMCMPWINYLDQELMILQFRLISPEYPPMAPIFCMERANHLVNTNSLERRSTNTLARGSVTRAASDWNIPIFCLRPTKYWESKVSALSKSISTSDVAARLGHLVFKIEAYNGFKEGSWSPFPVKLYNLLLNRLQWPIPSVWPPTEWCFHQ